MQHRVTTTRDHLLTEAAETVERMGAALGGLLRQSRLEVWEETDWLHAEELSLVMDHGAAEMSARRLVVARLVIPDDEGAYESIEV